MFISTYVKCPTCNCIVYDALFELMAIKEPCPNCRKTDEFREMWPSLFGAQWMTTISQHPLEDPIDKNMLSVMLCSAAELLMEDFLKEMLFHQKAIRGHIEIILEAHEGRWRRIGLFKRLCGISLKEALNELNLRDFHDAWEEIAVSRNNFVHGEHPTKSRKTPELDKLQLVRNKMLEAFYLLHNRFIAGLKLPCKVET